MSRVRLALHKVAVPLMTSENAKIFTSENNAASLEQGAAARQMQHMLFYGL